MKLGVRYIFLASGFTILATLFLTYGNDGLAIFFIQVFLIMLIACVEFPLFVVDADTVATTFTRAAAVTVSLTVASTELNSRNVLVQLILWHLVYSG